MLKNAKVADAVSAGQKERSDRTKLDQDWVLERLKDTAERCAKEGQYQPLAVLRASELVGRHLGMFTDKLKVDGGLEGLGERMARALRRLQDQQDEAVEEGETIQ